MTTLDDLRAIVRPADTQGDLDARLRAIYRRGVEDGARAVLEDYCDALQFSEGPSDIEEIGTWIVGRAMEQLR